MTSAVSKQQKTDYEDAYLSMREKYMNLSKQLRDKEDAWQLERVRLRKQNSSNNNIKSSRGLDDDHQHLNDSTIVAERVPLPAAPSTAVPEKRPESAGGPATTRKKPSPTSRPGTASTALGNRTNNFTRAPSNTTFKGVTFSSNGRNSKQIATTATVTSAKPSSLTAAEALTSFSTTSPVRTTQPSSSPPPQVASSPPRAPASNVSYSAVQFGALSQQLSPASSYNNSTTINQTNNANNNSSSGSFSTSTVPLPPTATSIPPVHFEVISLNNQPSMTYHQNYYSSSRIDRSQILQNPQNSPHSPQQRQQAHHFASVSSLLDHPGAKRPPEASMFWGIGNDELPLDQTISGRTVAEINDRLRAQLQDCEVQLRRFNQESVLNRQVMDRQESQIQQLEHQLLLIVQERDAMAQRTSATTASVSNLQSQLESQLQQHETVRNALEVQCRELRNKLINEIDQKEYLEREVSKAKSDVQEQLLTVASLQSRVSVSEASLSSQRNANETLLVEMRSLNEQLATERRKTLAATRDVHLASHSRQRTEELELQMQTIKQDMQAVQSENLNLLEKVTRSQEEALRTASQAVEAELAEAKSQASHWEHVALLQFRELEQNAKQRSQLRQELEATKADRDEASLLLSRLKSELAYALVKLDLCWPSHVKDTVGLHEDQLRTAFAKRFGSNSKNGYNAASSMLQGNTNSDNNNSSFSTYNNNSNPRQQQQQQQQQQHNDSLRGPVKEEDLVGELQAANAVLTAENESLRLQNSLLLDRLEEAGIHYREKTKELETKVDKVVRHEQANVAHASRQADRISFLESQVRNLRGSTVQSTFPIDELGVNETVFEVFVGQLLLDNPPPIQSAQASDCRAVPNVVAVVDFLIHESSVTHPVLESLHAAFDQTFAYRVNADAVLLHNIANGTIAVEIHEVRGTTHRAIAQGEIGFRELLRASHEKRPSIRTHVTLKKVPNNNNNTNSNRNDECETYGRIEIIITSRVPFPPLFVRLCDDFLDSASLSTNTLNSEETQLNAATRGGSNQKQSLLSTGAVSSTSPGRTLFMPDPRDSSISVGYNITSNNSNGSNYPKDQHQFRSAVCANSYNNNVNNNLPLTVLGAPGEDPIAVLMKCNQIKMKFIRVAVEFSEKEAPLLSWWYSFASNIGDSWVLPCAAEGKYDAPIEVTNAHDFSSSEELVSSLRKTIPVVAFDEAEQDPAKYWGIASMTLSALLAAPTQILSLQLPVLSPGGHIRATLFAEASIAAANH